MKRRTYPLEPRRITRAAWFYEERRGIDVVIEHNNDALGYVGTVRARIPWAKLEKAVANHRAVKRQRKP